MTDRTIAVGICTFRRPSLRQALLSLAVQDLPPGVTMRIMVADNDDQPSAEPLVAEVSGEVGREILYLHCPARNISLARNGILDAAREGGADLLAFLDDDEWVGPDWLPRLLDALDRSGAGAVFGPVRAAYGDGAPAWMKAGAFHDMAPELDAAGEVRAGHTCNVLFSLRDPAFAGRRFDLGFGRSGGEDTEFFAGAKSAGARFVPAPLALAFEDVPADRARLRWLAKRRFRMGQTHGSLIGRGAGPARRAGLALVAAAKVAASFALIGPGLPWAERRSRALLRSCLHAGTVTSLLGMRRITLYGGKEVPSRARALRLSQNRSAE